VALVADHHGPIASIDSIREVAGPLEVGRQRFVAVDVVAPIEGGDDLLVVEGGASRRALRRETPPQASPRTRRIADLRTRRTRGQPRRGAPHRDRRPRGRSRQGYGETGHRRWFRCSPVRRYRSESAAIRRHHSYDPVRAAVPSLWRHRKQVSPPGRSFEFDLETGEGSTDPLLESVRPRRSVPFVHASPFRSSTRVRSVRQRERVPTAGVYQPVAGCYDRSRRCLRSVRSRYREPSGCITMGNTYNVRPAGW